MGRSKFFIFPRVCFNLDRLLVVTLQYVLYKLYQVLNTHIYKLYHHNYFAKLTS